MKLKRNTGYEDGNYISAVDLWPDERLVKRQLFDKHDRGQEVVI